MIVGSTQEPSLSGGMLTLLVGVKNGQDHPFVFSPDSIEAYFGDRKLKVYKYHELAAKIKTQTALAGFFYSLGSGYNYTPAQITAWSTSTSTLPNGGVQYNTNYIDGTIHDPASEELARELAEKRRREFLEDLTSTTNKVLENLSRSILKKTTIFPGEFLSGMVVLDKVGLVDSAKVINMLIKAGEEEHEFRLMPRNDQNKH